MTTLRPISFHLETPVPHFFSRQKTNKKVRFTGDRWGNKHMIKLSRKEFRQLVRNKVEASLGKRLHFFWGHRVLNQAESSARNEMYKAYQDIKSVKLNGKRKYRGRDKKTIYQVTIKNSSGLLSDTKYALKNKMLREFSKEIFEQEKSIKMQKNGGKKLTDLEIKILRRMTEDTAKEMVSKTYVDKVFNTIRKWELNSAKRNRREFGTIGMNLVAHFENNVVTREEEGGTHSSSSVGLHSMLLFGSD